MLIERRWKASVVFGAVVAPTVGAWLTWSAIGAREAPDQARNYMSVVTHTPVEMGEVSLLVRLGSRIAGNAFRYLVHTVPSSLKLTTVAGTVVDNALWTILLIGFSTAGMLALYRRWRVASLYLASYGAILLLWPWSIERMLVPVLPLIILAFVGGGWEVLNRLVPRFAPGLLAILVSVLAVESGTAIARIPDCASVDPSGSACQPANRIEYARAARFVRDSLELPGAVVASRAHTFSLQSGRSVVPVYRLMRGEAAGLRNRMQAFGARFVIVGGVSSDDRTLASLIRENCSEFEVIRSFSPTTLLLEPRVEDAEVGVGSCEAIEVNRRSREGLRRGGE